MKLIKIKSCRHDKRVSFDSTQDDVTLSKVEVLSTLSCLYIKLFLFTAIIILSFSSVCVADIRGEGVSTDSNPLKDEEALHDPFALPVDVNFLKKSQEAENADSGSGEWIEGMVASNVKGIFRSNGKSIANINHVWVETGKWVGEEQVTAINRDSVVLSGKSGVKRTLLMQEDGARFETTKRIISRTVKEK